MELAKLTNIAILPTPGMGHLIPLTEFGRQLILHYNLSVTLIIPTDGSDTKIQKEILEALPKRINIINLPPVNFDDLPESAKIETRIALSVTRSLPALRDTLKELSESTRLSALVVDVFGVFTFDLAKEFGLSTYIFYASTAMSLSALLHLPKLDKTITCEYKDLVKPLKFPGCVPVYGRDLVDPAQDKTNDAYRFILEVCNQCQLADGILVNSFLELEPGAFKALMEEDWCKPEVYPIGPVLRSASGSDCDGSNDSNRCLKWLDQQPVGSVLFVSFGSGGTLSLEQLTELALGLEMSEQRFLWVVKSPDDEHANASFFNAQTIKDPFDFLPKGFLNRTKGLGIVVSSWVPQVQILSHDSIGGFLSHCGWNSTIESIVHGVPLIAWPLFAEQRLNAVQLVDDLEVALKVKKNKNGIVMMEDIADNAKGLIQGEKGKKLRNKMKDLKGAAAIALTREGSSRRSLSEVVEKWTI